MKKFTLLISFLAIFFSGYSQHVNSEYARKIASVYLEKNSAHTFRSSLNLEFESTKAEVVANDTLFYIFEAKSKKGFIIISADYRAEPVLCYSVDGQIESPQGVPPAFTYLLDSYKAYMKDIKKNYSARNLNKNSRWDEIENNNFLKAVNTVKDPLITTKWNQWQYYNDYCPEDSDAWYGYGGRVPTGCVATAMAQLMKYHNYPNYGTGSYSYTPRTNPQYGIQSADFTGQYAWDDMPEKAPSVFGNEISKLMYHCGVAVDMNYHPDGSGAYSGDVALALKTYFKYVDATTYYWKPYSNGGISDEQWIQMIKTELDNDRPVYYSGNSGSGSGHAFICDGYDSDDKFHFNFGWGGKSDGYFTVEGIEYYQSPAIIIGAQPKPIVTTSDKKSVTGNEAVFTGIINPDGTNVTDIRFELCEENSNASPIYIDAVYTSSNAKDTVTISSLTATLTAGKHYLYRLTAKNKDGITVYGEYYTVSISEDRWMKQNAGVNDRLNSIHMLSETTGYICGYNGTILKTTDGGNTWTKQESGVEDILKGIQFIDDATGFTVTSTGKILKTTDGGANWEIIYNNSAVLSNVTGLYVENETNLWISSFNGLFLHNTDESFYVAKKVYGSCWALCKANDITFVRAAYSTGLTYSIDNCNSWPYLPTYRPTSVMFYGVAAYPNSGYALGCGEKGILQKADLRAPASNGYFQQEQLTSPVTTALNGIAFSSPDIAYAVGDSGTIIKTSNKGDDWEVISPLLINTNNLRSVSFPSLSKGWIVGDAGTILYCGPASLSVEAETDTIGALVNDSIVLNVNTNVSWNAVSSAEWLTLTFDTILGTITVTATESNRAIMARTATITISGEGTEDVTFTIIQEGAAPYLLVHDMYHFFHLPEDITEMTIIDLDTNLDEWDINHEAPWLEVTKDLNAKTMSILALSENNEPSTRSAEVNISGEGIETLTLTINQYPSLPVGISGNMSGESNIYPNPTSGTFYVTMKNSMDDAIIDVHNIAGQKVYERRLSFKSQIPQEINLNDFAAGTYYITIRNTDNRIAYKHILIIK